MTPSAVERGRETRARLLAAAEQLIAEEGWGSVTTRKVADRAGLRAGLVHYHFDTVADLLIDASLASARRELEGALALFSQAADGVTGLAQVIEMMAAYSGDDPATVLFSEMLLAATRSERLRSELAVLLREWRTATAQWLHAHGGPDDAEATALLLGATLDGLVLHRLIDPDLAAVTLSGPMRRLAGLGDTPGEPAARNVLSTESGR